MIDFKLLCFNILLMQSSLCFLKSTNSIEQCCCGVPIVLLSINNEHMSN